MTAEKIKTLAPYAVLVVMFIAGLVLYWTKPTPEPQIIYITKPDTTQVWQKQRDSLTNIIDALEQKADHLQATLTSQSQQHTQELADLATIPATDQVKLFGQTTGDTTLQMRSQDSLTLVPLPCIKKANELILKGDQAARELETQRMINDNLKNINASLTERGKQDLNYIAYLEAKDIIKDKRITKTLEQLEKEKSKNRVLGFTTGGAALLALLALVL